MNFTFASLFGSLLFSTIGMVALGYGKRNGSANPMMFGAALMLYPYFVTQTWLLYGIGTVLTGLMVWLRE